MDAFPKNRLSQTSEEKVVDIPEIQFMYFYTYIGVLVNQINIHIFSSSALLVVLYFSILSHLNHEYLCSPKRSRVPLQFLAESKRYPSILI